MNESCNQTSSVLTAKSLSKCFGSYWAVKDVNLAIAKGEIFGFLGPNGAGKTTTIKMLAGLLKPDKGEIVIDGMDLIQKPEQCKQVTGYIPDRPFLYEKLTCMEFLRFISSLYNLTQEVFDRNVYRMLTLFDLEDWQDHLIESYSHGMRQKLIITSAFMLEPKLIIVDEPMVGLDPKSARIVKELFKEHAKAGGTVFLSTHSLEVAEELCHRISIIMNGEIIITGTLEALRNEVEGGNSSLEDIFLQLTGAYELHEVIKAIKS